MYMGLQSDENCWFWSWQNNSISPICPKKGLPEGLWFIQVLSGKVEMGSFVLSWEQRLPSSNPIMNVMSIQFSSDCRPMYIYPRCCQRGPKLFRGYVWVDFYLIYSSSGASWWWFWWASTSRQRCGHVECPPFLNYSSWMDGSSWNLLEMVL